ncbi:hypothetical protein GW571_14845 (plasmid) [Clavibacter capsici]|uniref:hypothetical protein n=1 Tax=Clavibacter capsici TaxID=1874630 RepID=UPI0014285C1D|nr:hypothetical protein [Clavibacter capsici]QIS43513.1 hypothetical protein GW571_14845 [Clavibacter capsici]
MAATEEASTGAPLPGDSAHGSNAVEIGAQLLLDALGRKAAVSKAIGRPKLCGAAPDGEHSPTIHVRLSRYCKDRLEQRRIVQRRKYAADLVRDAIDEYRD